MSKINLQLFAGDPDTAYLDIYSHDGQTLLCGEYALPVANYSPNFKIDGTKLLTRWGYGADQGFNGYYDFGINFSLATEINGPAVYVDGDEFTLLDPFSVSDPNAQYEYTMYLIPESATRYKHLTTSDNTKIQVDSTVRDEAGVKLSTNYALKDELSNITSTDVTITEVN